MGRPTKGPCGEPLFFPFVGERIAALEAVEPEQVKGREGGVDAERKGGASLSRERDRASEPAMEPSRAPKGLDHDLGL